jgi:hypothetical protein
MANVKASWTLPNTRKSGRPLSVDDIAAVEVEMSADGGANYGAFGEFPPAQTEMVVQDLEPGNWFFRARVADKDGRRSDFLVSSIIIPDGTAPNALMSFNLNLG